MGTDGTKTAAQTSFARTRASRIDSGGMQSRQAATQRVGSRSNTRWLGASSQLCSHSRRQRRLSDDGQSWRRAYKVGACVYPEERVGLEFGASKQGV